MNIEREVMIQEISEVIPKGYFEAFKCQICQIPVYFPICNIKSKYGKFVWGIYSIVLNEDLNLCFDCKQIYNKLKKEEKEESKKNKFRFRFRKKKEVKIPYEVFKKSVELGLSKDEVIMF